MTELAIIMPVYNEEGAISKVLQNWVDATKTLGIKAEIHAYNDGSKDRTSEILKKFASQEPSVIPHDKPNSGHGPTILQGYRENSHIPWLFQIDSDDELGPEQFAELWNQRHQYDFLICKRDGRYSPLPRRVITFVARCIVRVFYGSGVYDVNSPYRLMRSEKFADLFKQTPADTFAPNVIVSGYACLKKMRIYQGKASFRERTTGEVSIKKWKLAKAAMKSFAQTIGFRFSLT